MDRRFAIWLASFSIAALVCIFYFRAPVVPVLWAGVLTLGFVLLKRSNKRGEKR